MLALAEVIPTVEYIPYIALQTETQKAERRMTHNICTSKPAIYY